MIKPIQNDNQQEKRNWKEASYLLDQIIAGRRASDRVADMMEPVLSDLAISRIGATRAAYKEPAKNKWIDELALKIVQSQKFFLLSDYYKYFKTHSADAYLTPSQSQTDFATVSRNFRGAYMTLYTKVTAVQEGKFLVGTYAHAHTLWVDKPTINVDDPLETWNQVNLVLLYFGSFMSYFTGEGRQGQYDRLMFPIADKWPNAAYWDDATVARFERIVAERLGFEKGIVDEDEYLHILSQAYLGQKYKLVEGTPVLVRLQEHPFIHQLILMPKQDRLFCRIEMRGRSNVLCNISLQEVDFDSTINFSRYSPAPSQAQQSPNYALAALIATIYRDLVTVDEIELNEPRMVGNSGSGKNKDKDKGQLKLAEDDRPKMVTTAWQYIRRKTYINKADVAEDVIVERADLNEAEQNRQRAIRRWHSVCGHVRRYVKKPEWMAGGERQDLALRDGVILRTGETYVRPHTRNEAALNELGDISIQSIPHYLRRKGFSG